MLLRIFLTTFLVLISLDLFAQQILRVKGRKAVMSEGSYDVEVGKKYLILVKGKKKGSSKQLTKKALIRVVKTLNHKILMIVLKGEIFENGKVRKLKKISGWEKHKKVPKNIRPKIPMASDTSLSKSKKKGSRKKKVSPFTSMGLVLGGISYTPGALVDENGEGLGIDFSSMVGLQAGFRYRFNSSFELRGMAFYVSGTATELSSGLSSSTSFDTRCYNFSLGPAVHFYDNFFVFAEYGPSKFTVVGDSTVSNITTSFDVAYGGTILSGGGGYQNRINDQVNYAIEASAHKLSWTTLNAGAEDTAIQYSQTAISFSGLISYNW